MRASVCIPLSVGGHLQSVTLLLNECNRPECNTHPSHKWRTFSHMWRHTHMCLSLLYIWQAFFTSTTQDSTWRILETRFFSFFPHVGCVVTSHVLLTFDKKSDLACIQAKTQASQDSTSQDSSKCFPATRSFFLCNETWRHISRPTEQNFLARELPDTCWHKGCI